MRPLHLPDTLDELTGLLTAAPESRVLAGGTDLLPALRLAPPDRRPLLGLERIAELAEVEEDADGGMAIGAMVRFAQLAAHPGIRHRYPLLAQAAATVGGPAIRNMATLGGNLATASPAGDSLPALHLLDAIVELHRAGACRQLPMARFITGPRTTALEPGEVIGRVLLPPPRVWHRQRFDKVGLRRSLAIAVTSLAAAVRLAPDGVVTEARLAWGSVGPTVWRCEAAEAILIGRPLDAASLAAAADRVREAVRPIDDLRATAAYRRAVAAGLLFRLLA